MYSCPKTFAAVVLSLLLMASAPPASAQEIQEKVFRLYGPLTLQFSEPPVLGKEVEVAVGVMPRFITGGPTDAWLEIPEAFRVVHGDTAWTGDVEVAEQGIFNLRVQAVTLGVCTFRVCATAMDAIGGMRMEDCREYWVKVGIDSADVASNPHFHHVEPYDPSSRSTKLVPGSPEPGGVEHQYTEDQSPQTVRPMESEVETPSIGEIIYRDGEMWVREPGEQEFVLSIETEGPSGPSPADTITYEVLIPIVDDDVLAVLREMELELPESLPDTLSATLSRKQLRTLKVKGVSFTLSQEHPRANTESPKCGKQPSDENKKGKSSRAPSNEIYKEDFETNEVPGDEWDADDNNLDSGTDYWGDESEAQGARVANGAWSCYCADNSDVGGQQYDNDMDAYFANWDPIYLGGYSTPHFSFWTWYSTEPVYDYLQLYSSPNGTTWYPSTVFTGDSGDWEIPVYELTGLTNFYLKFVFFSDDLVHAYEGAYVDEILLTEGLPPNLFPYQPSGWNHPVVPSSVTGTNTVNTLYAGLPT